MGRFDLLCKKKLPDAFSAGILNFVAGVEDKFGGRKVCPAPPKILFWLLAKVCITFLLSK